VSNIVTYIQSESDLELLKRLRIDLAILAMRPFARDGISFDEGLKLIRLATASGTSISLEMDKIYTQNEFEIFKDDLKKLSFEMIASLRVADLGVAKYIMEFYPFVKLELWTEAIGSNVTALIEHERYFGRHLSTLILSLQLSKSQLANFCTNISTDKELLVLGRIPIFYSPRHLLTGRSDADWMEVAMASSEETPHSGFSVVENKNGTLMYNPKDIFLVDKLSELMLMGVERFRLDLRHLKFDELEKLLPKVVSSVKDGGDSDCLKKEYPRKVISGYYNANKSDVLFAKLKNPNLIRDDSIYIGYVVSSLKGKYLAIVVDGEYSLKIGEQVKFVTPEGKTVKLAIGTLYLADGNNVLTVAEGVCFTGHIKGISAKSTVSIQRF